MPDLSIENLIYTFNNELDYDLACQILKQIDSTNTAFRCELEKRWIRYTIEEIVNDDGN